MKSKIGIGRLERRCNLDDSEEEISYQVPSAGNKGGLKDINPVLNVFCELAQNARLGGVVGIWIRICRKDLNQRLRFTKLYSK